VVRLGGGIGDVDRLVGNCAIFLAERRQGLHALLDFVVIFHGYDYFSFGMSFSKIPDRFSSLTQRVTSIDNRNDFARRQKLLEES